MLYVASLSEPEKSELEFLIRTGTAGAARRARIVQLSADGKSVREIADKIGLHYQNVRKWLHRYRTEGIQGLRHRGAGKSRNAKYPDETKRRIAEIAAAGPRSLGLSFDEWSLPKLRVYLIQQALVSDISIETLRQTLLAHGVRWQNNRRASPPAAKTARGQAIGSGRIGVHFDKRGNVAISDLTTSDSRAGLEIVSEHHQKGACDIQAVYDSASNSITVRFFRRTRAKTGKDD